MNNIFNTVICREPRPLLPPRKPPRKPITHLHRLRGLSSQSERVDDLPVPLDIFVLHIVEKPAAATDQHQQPSPGMMILFMDLKMIRQVGDSMGQQTDLNFR